MIRIGKTTHKTAEVVAAKMSEVLEKMGEVCTITLDNGLIRRNWPKGMKPGHLTDADLREQEMLINAMPRKVLGGLTPLEVYAGKRVAFIC